METTSTVIIMRSGQATIPKIVRDKLGVGAGDKIEFRVRKDGVVEIDRPMTDEEFFAQMDARNSAKTRKAMRHNAGKTMNELRAEWAKSPAGRRYFKEKYGEF